MTMTFISFRSGVAPVLIAAMLLGAPLGCAHDPNILKQKYLASGERYEAQGKLKEAYIQFSNALKIDHNYGDAHYQLAKTYMAMGSMTPAYAELLKTVDLQPANLQARIDLGNMFLAGNNPAKATEQANAVLALQSNNADAYALLSSIASSSGDHASAVTDIQRALAINPNRAGFHLAYGLIESSDPATSAAARDELRKAIALDPKNVTAHLVLSSLLESSGDLQGAVAQDQAAISADPQNIHGYTSLAQLYQRKNNSEQAESTLLQGTEALADNSDGSQLLLIYFEHTGQMDRALPAYAGLVAKYPKSVFLNLVYAQLLFDTGDLPRAKRIVATLLKAHPRNPDVATLNGVFLLRDGKSNDAFQSLQKAAKDSPDNVHVIVWLARAAFATGDLTTAEQNFRNTLHLDPTNLEAEEGLAQISSQQANYTVLTQVASDTIAAHPNFSPAYVWRGSAEANQKEFDKADTDFQHALTLAPGSAGASLNLGQLRLAEGHTSQGISLLEQALANDPNSIPALHALTSYYLQNQQPARAIAIIQQQLSHSPNNSAMANELAQAQIATGDIADAVTTSQKAMLLNPADSSLLMTYTRAAVLHGDTQKAVATWQQWETSHPQSTQVETLLGMLEQAQGNTSKAITYYQTALKVQPDQPVAANNLAYILLQSGQDIDTAFSLAQTARRYMPDSPSTADTLAWAYYHKAMYASARDLLLSAITLAPDDAAFHYHLGMTYSKLSAKQDAILQLNKAAALAPGSSTATDANQALRALM